MRWSYGQVWAEDQCGYGVNGIVRGSLSVDASLKARLIKIVSAGMHLRLSVCEFIVSVSARRFMQVECKCGCEYEGLYTRDR